jgi:hypothetical protein
VVLLSALAAAGANWMNLWDGGDHYDHTSIWNESTKEHNIADMLWNLQNALGNLSAVGLADKAYLYGFDEAPESNATMQAIYALYGAVKARFPKLRTMGESQAHPQHFTLCLAFACSNDCLPPTCVQRH